MKLKSGIFTRKMRVSAVFAFVLLSATTAGLAQTEPYWKSWPPDPDWVALTGHIGRCYQGLLWRCRAVGVSTNGIEPTYEYPWYDYEAFTRKIDELAPKFVCQLYTNNAGNFADHFSTPVAAGVYTNQFPFWSISNLHATAGFTNWSTNVPLHSWAVSGRELQEQVAAALPLLFMTCLDGTNVGWTGAEGYSAVSNFATNLTIQASNDIAFPPESANAWRNFDNDPAFSTWPQFHILSEGTNVPSNGRPEISGSWEARLWHLISMTYVWSNDTDWLSEDSAKIASTSLREVRDRLEKCSATNVSARFSVTGLVADVRSRCQFYYREEALTNSHSGFCLGVFRCHDPVYLTGVSAFGSDYGAGAPWEGDPLGPAFLRTPRDFARPYILYFKGGDSEWMSKAVQVSAAALCMSNYAPSSAEAFYSTRIHDFYSWEGECFAHTLVDSFSATWNNNSADPIIERWNYLRGQAVSDRQGSTYYRIESAQGAVTAERYLSTFPLRNQPESMRWVWRHSAHAPMALVIWEPEDLSVPEDSSSEPCDTDLDDVSESSVLPRNIRPDPGLMTWLAEQEEPELRLWLAETPAWYAGIPVHAWLSQGAGCGLPYQYLVPALHDEDGSCQSLNLASKVLESNATQDEEKKEKKVSVLRPRGQLVVFDFPWNAELAAFSDVGYPQGRHAARSYVLRDRTPAYHKDSNYDLCFDSGIIHQFGVSMLQAYVDFVAERYGGNWDAYEEFLRNWMGRKAMGVLLRVKRYDGCQVWIHLPAEILDGEIGGALYPVVLTPGFTLEKLTGIDSSTGNPFIEWRAGIESEQVRAVLSNKTRLDWVKRTGGSGAVSNILSTSIDACGRVTGFSVDGVEPAGALNVAWDADSDELSYSWGTMTRAQSGATDAARTVTIQTMHQDHGSVEEILELGTDDRLRKRTVNANGDSVWTRYQYAGNAGRYDNGFPRGPKITGIEHSDGKQISFAYRADTGWLASRTEPVGNGVDRVAEFSYEKLSGSDGDSADPQWAVERPRQVVEKYGTAVISGTLYSFQNGRKSEERRCAVWPAAWNSADNLARAITLNTNSYLSDWRDLSGLPLQAEEPGLTSVWTHVVSDALVSDVHHSDGREEYVAIDRYGNQRAYQGIESGVTVTARRVWIDEWGRPVGAEDQMSGDITSNLDWTVYGPARTRERDGSFSTRQFYPGGLLKLETDGVTGEQTSFAYDPLANCVGSTRSCGTDSVTVQRQFDASGRLKTQTDTLGNTVFNWQSTAWGSSVVITRPDGAVEKEERYRDGSLKRRTGSGVVGWIREEYGVVDGVYREATVCLDAQEQDTPEWNAVSYDMSGRPVCAIKPLASGAGVASNVMRYDAQGRLCETEDEEGARELTKYGPDRRVQAQGRHVDGAANELTSASRDRFKTFQTTVMADRTRSVERGYLAAGSGVAEELSASERMHHGRSGSVTVAGRRDEWSRSVAQSCGVWQEEERGSDGRRVVRKYQHARLEQTELYGRDGTLHELETRNYDGLGALEQIAHSRSGVTTYQYDSCRRLSAVIPSDLQKGPQTFTYHPGTTRWQSRSDGDGRVYFRDYYLNGLLKREYGSTWDVSYEYDKQGRCVKMNTMRNGHVVITEWKYNQYTGELAEKWEHGQGKPVARYAWKKNGELDRVTFADDSAAVCLYDAASGDRTGISYTDETGGLGMQFDRAGRQTGVNVEGGVAVSCDYTVDGRVSAEQVNGNGNVSNAAISYAYGTHGGVTALVWQVDGVASGRNDVAWDQHMRVSGITSRWCSVDYGYLTNGCLVTGVTVRVVGGLMLRKSVDWDEKNERVRQIGWTADGVVCGSYEYQYPTNSDKVARVFREDGTSWEYGYGPRGELESGGYFDAKGDPVPGRQFGYQYDEIGNMIRGGRVSNGVTNGYFVADDGNRHVIREWGGSVDIAGTAASNAVISVNGVRADRQGKYFAVRLPVDNGSCSVRTGVTVYAVLNQGSNEVYAAVNGVIEAPQAVENVEHRQRGGIQRDSRFDYEWDGRDRLVRLTSRDGLMKVDFTYDGYGRRVRKVVNRRADAVAAWGEVARHEFYYEGWTLMCERIQRAGSDPVVREYTWDSSMGLPALLAFSEASGSATSVYVAVTDRLGSVGKLVATADGSVVAEYGYAPFGQLISEVAESGFSGCPFRFHGKYYDHETGFYYFGYRYYDPASGKWLSPDPLQERGGINLTCFCNNDPVNGTDELGLAAYFFGGTGNSLADDGWSNVEILYRAWDNNAGHGEAFYVPGVYSGYAPDGTPYEGWIKRPPLSQGGYGASLQARADEMMKKLRTQLAAGDKEVNVFGFSRGSLTALVFLNMIAKEVEKGTDPLFQGIAVNQTVLLDNVEHTWNDMPHDLPKNLNYTHQPMHLIAVDEQRDQFFDKDVLNMEGALQIGFRGVHANVGGGYDRDGLAAHSLRFVIQSMNACKMKVFRNAAIHRQMQKYGMLENGVNKAPADNDTWFYTMGTRIFPEGMFLAPTFRFNRTRLKNPMDVNVYDEFNSLHAEKWESGYRYSVGEGWVK